MPADTLGSRYHFDAGLRERIAARPPLPYPSLYESSSGKITGLDYTLLIDAGVTEDEMRAIFGVQSRPASLREPLPAGFVAHAHLYAFSNPDTPTDADRKARWKGLSEFIAYALTKPEVRVVD